MRTARENAPDQNTETPERAFLVREFEAADLSVAGRTVDVRVVPFGERALAIDGHGGVERGVPYQEEWVPGAFDHQLNAANRVLAKFGHSPHIVDVVGHGVELRRERDGYHVSAVIHDTIPGNTALELLRAGSLPAVSVEARPVKSLRTAEGVVQRVKAHLKAFAFCERGAYASAQVLALREEVITDAIDEDLLPVDLDAGIVERCRRLGIALPQRYETHPAPLDTPAETGTSEEAAPVDDENTTTSEE